MVQQKKKTCKECDKDFESARKDKEFCSRACGVKYRRNQSNAKEIEKIESDTAERVAKVKTRPPISEEIKDTKNTPFVEPMLLEYVEQPEPISKEEYERQYKIWQKNNTEADEMFKRLKQPYGRERFNSLMDKGFIATGFPTFDRLVANGETRGNLPYGGIPRGRLTEIYGRSSVGKSEFARQVAIRTGLKTLYIDTENAHSEKMFPTNVTLLQEGIIENIIDTVADALSADIYDLIIVDSIANITTRKEMGDGSESSGFGDKAKIMNRWCRLLAAQQRDAKAAIVFINQVRPSMDMFDKTEVVPGGKGIGYYASLRVKFFSASRDKKTEKVVIDKVSQNKLIRQNIRFRFDKNRFGPAGLENVMQLDLASIAPIEEALIRDESHISVKLEEGEEPDF